MALQSDGKPVVVGDGNSKFVAIRYNLDGTLDKTFGGGIVTTGVSYGDYSSKVLIQPDGKILVAGYANNGNHYRATLLRYNSNGTLDTSFNGGGIVVADLGPVVGGTVSDSAFISGVILQNGQIVLSGYADSTPILARYNSNGTPDTSFGTSGLAHPIPSTQANEASAIALAPDGGYYVLASSFGDGSSLTHLTSTGQIETSFGTQGFTALGGGGYGLGGDIAVQPDGSIVVAAEVGSGHAGSSNSVGITTVSSGGQFLFGVGQGGGGQDYAGHSLALAPDGRAIVGTNGSIVRYRTMADPPEGVRLEGSILTVLGEGASNSVDLVSDGSNYTVSLNGQVQAFPVSSVSRIDVRLYGSGNSITAGPNIPLDVIDMSAGGHNTATIASGTLRLIIPGTGNDVVTLPAVTDGGSGNSVVQGVASDTVVVSGTDGNDQFNVSTSPPAVNSPSRHLVLQGPGHVQVNTGAGDDTVQIPGPGGPSVTVMGGSGNDVITMTGGGPSSSPDLIVAGTGNTQVLATTVPNSTVTFEPNPAGSNSIRVIGASATGQIFTIGDNAVSTADGFVLNLPTPTQVKSLEVDGGPGWNFFGLTRTVPGIATTIVGGGAANQFVATGAPLATVANVNFVAGGRPVDSAFLADGPPGDGKSHTYSIGTGVILRDGVATLQYAGLYQLSLQTADSGASVNITDAAGMSELSVIGGAGKNTIQVVANPGGLGMAPNSKVSMSDLPGAITTYAVVPDPNAAYSIAGDLGFHDSLQVAPADGAVRTFTGPGSGQYTFTSRRPITFRDIGQIDGIPVPPTAFAATPLAGSTSAIVLTWAGNSAAETGFAIERQDQPGGAYTQIGALPANATSFTDQNLPPSTSFSYRISAIDANGASEFAFASGTTLAPEAPYGGASAVIPGLIQAENFDNGGNTISYASSSPGNSGGTYRPGVSVGIDPTADAGGGFVLGAQTGDWFKYGSSGFCVGSA